MFTIAVRLVANVGSTASDEEGQALMEYALMLLFVAVVVVAMLTLLGTSVSNLIQTVANAFP